MGSNPLAGVDTCHRSKCAISILSGPPKHRTPIDNPTYDNVIVGAGFPGINLLYSLRKLGYRCQINESGTDLGGVWHWHTYPGCRIDTPGFIYQLSIPEVSETWSYKEKYPSADELRAYFPMWIRCLGSSRTKWRTETGEGPVTHSQLFIPCVGFATELYVPEFPGLETFKVEVCHSASWPKDGINMKGKKVAVIGTGASGLGYLDQPGPHATFEVAAEECEALFVKLYDRGGVAFLLGGYNDLLVDEKANREAYEIWAKKTRARIADPSKRDLLAPLEPPHPIGAKRSCSEQDYFEMFNSPNVELVNLREAGHGTAAINSKEIKTQDGGFYPEDAIALADGLQQFYW
ncbi:FAD/NAD(P)-binding domain-containing protein [Aspergillus indologenus CBS 114.80]|uniref:FAD/NAD(P)-binding domain-containing protein n=1 Tax=Aspergillus indologenus CBS 114.80 TaxID=1450541 RepID=A0A2V5HM84_9EURO|nr:FAD/NAD(P)-binding domain-containing protein [Aspergillus indologenus CBS 114.80]